MDGCFGLIVVLVDILTTLALTFLLVGLIYNWVCNDYGFEFSDTIWTVLSLITFVVSVLGFWLICRFIDKKLSE